MLTFPSYASFVSLLQNGLKIGFLGQELSFWIIGPSWVIYWASTHGANNFDKEFGLCHWDRGLQE